MAKWIQLLVTGITVGSIYSLIALGYVTIYRTSRIVNMAQGAFVMFGAFFAYSFLSEIGLPYWLSAILAIVGVAILSALDVPRGAPAARQGLPGLDHPGHHGPQHPLRERGAHPLGRLRQERAGVHR